MIKILFYDFEVFSHDWLVVIKDTETRTTYKIVNDVDELFKIYNSNKNNIWIGFNSRSYDQYIFKGILLGMDPKEINDHIILKKLGGWQYSRLFNKIQLYNYDIMTDKFKGLKQLEGFMGNDIRETTVEFDTDRKLTPNEIEEVLFYCNHDVEQTMQVFINRKEEFESHMSLIKEFNLPLRFISKTQAQLAAIILDASKIDTKEDEFSYSIVKTLKLKKYNYIREKYEVIRDEITSDQALLHELLNDKKKKKKWYNNKSFVEVVNGIKVSFGFGGIHGAVEKAIEEGVIVNSDVESYYPSLSLRYEFLSRSVRNYTTFKSIYDTNLQLKHEKRKKEREPFKRICNICYGATKDEFNNLYDPMQANNVCINGQLLLLDLVERVEELLPTAKVLQVNTDGVMFNLEKEEDFDVYQALCDEWQERSGMKLEHDRIKKLIQKDVNNYLVIMENGKVKSKGAYVKALNRLDYDLPIVNKAMMDYFINGTNVEITINDCDNLIEFQKVVKISNKYKYALHGNKKLKEKILRVFASKSNNDFGVYKVHESKDKPDKVAGTPERCFIENGDIKGIKVPRKLDKQWYIDTAKKRIKDFVGEM
ncbi:hypothetical protein ACQPU1_06445 [Clostridium paraputrificum]|uniref:hypothetical protein n=1 Tax=Clostridium paraputrificum TaxID=29363 RepID=UPI003D32CFF6